MATSSTSIRQELDRGTFADGQADPGDYPGDLQEGTFALQTSTGASPQPRRRRGLGFWVVAFAFATVMAFTTVPTPLWSLYAQRDRFSSLTVTIAFAVYALAVALSLFLVGHLSDSYGRRRVLMPALVLEILAGVVFAVWSSLPALLVARTVERARHRRGDRDGDGLDLRTGRRAPACADRRPPPRTSAGSGSVGSSPVRWRSGHAPPWSCPSSSSRW